MLSKKKKIFILCGMLVLLVAAGCLNIFLNKSSSSSGNGGSYAGSTSYGSFFESARVDRLAARNETISQLDAIITNSSSSAESVKEAEATKLKLATTSEVEQVLETLIKALGYDDVFVTASTENVNVIVKAEEISSVEAAQILNVVVTETDKSANNVIIIPIK